MYKMTKIKKDTKQISSNVKLLLEAAWRGGGVGESLLGIYVSKHTIKTKMLIIVVYNFSANTNFVGFVWNSGKNTAQPLVDILGRCLHCFIFVTST